jgi:hypothetical protein
MRVHIFASDPDGRSLGNASEAIKVYFSGQTVAFRWDQAFGELVADISEGFTGRPGVHEISVKMSGWNYTVDENFTCILLQKSVTVVGDQQVGFWVLIVALGVCALIILLFVVWAKRNSSQLKSILGMVMTETVRLVIAIVFDISDLATDVLTAYKVVFEDALAIGPRWKIGFAVLGCLSIVVGSSSLFHQSRHLWLVRGRITKLLQEQKNRVYTTADDEKLQHLAWEEKKILRDMQAKANTLFCLCFEDLPMIGITLALILSEGVNDKLVSRPLSPPLVQASPAIPQSAPTKFLANVCR